MTLLSNTGTLVDPNEKSHSVIKTLSNGSTVVRCADTVWKGTGTIASGTR